jgi:hypothetical protein
MALTFEILKEKSREIMTEIRVRMNTAVRIGSMFLYIIEKLEEITLPLQQSTAQGIPEAPVTGKIYGRKNRAWVEVTETEETETGIADLADFDDYFNNDFLIEF